MAGKLNQLNMTISELSEADVVTLRGLQDAYQAGGGTNVTATVSAPSRSLNDFNSTMWSVSYSRATLNFPWATEDSDYLASIINTVAPLTP